MPDKKISDLVDGGDPQNTDEFVVARGGTNNKLAWSSLSAAATAGNINVTLSGNTAGALAGISSGTLTFAGGNNITLSQAGNAVTISGPNILGAQTGISGLANSETTYTSGTVSLSEQGALTIRSTTGQQFQFSVPNTSSLSATGIVSVSTNGSTISIGASQSVQPETQTFIAGISASDTLYTSGNVRLTGVGGGVTVSSNTGQRIDISVAAPVAQTVQTQNVVDLTLSGNTAGALALVSSGTLTLAGGNNITVSQAGNAITISGPNIPAESQTFIAAISASDTLYTSGNVRFTGVGGGITVSSNTGQRVDLSVAAQSVQPETQTFIAGIRNSETTYTSGTVNLSVVGGPLTIRSTTGNAFQFSASQSVQAETQTFVGGIQNSQTTYTSGTVNLSVVAGNLTIRSTTGQAFQFSMSQTVQAETQTAISGIANSQTTYTSGTVSLSELGAVTIRSTTGNQYQISVNSQTVQTQNMVAVSATNTLYSSGTVLFTGSNMITVKSSGAGQTIILDATQSVQPETQTFIAGIQNSETTYTSGSVKLSVVGGNMTIRSTTGQAFQFSVSQSVQAETQTAISGIANSQTTYTSGTVSLSELGAITIRSTTGNQYQFSVNSQTAETAISGLANSQTTYTSGTVSLSELGAITIRSTTGNQFQFSVNSQTVQTQGILNVALSNIGNTAGDTGINSGTRLVLAGGNNITLSASSAAGATTITISAPNLGAGAMSAGVSTGGNTAGATGITGTQLVLVGTNMISLSQTTGANGGTVSIDATQSVQTQGILSMGVSTGGATSGNTTVNTGSRFVLAGTNITLSQGTAAGATTVTVSAPATSSLSATGQVSISTNGSTISIGVANPMQSFREPINPLLMAATQGIGASAATQTTVTAWVMPMSLPNDLAFNNLLLAAHVSFSSNTTSISSVNYSFSMGASLGFYTLTGSTMSQVTSFSNSLGFTNATAAAVGNMSMTARVGYGGSSTTKSASDGANMTSIMSSINSVRQIPLNWTTVSNTLTRGQYWAVGAFSALTAGAAQASLSQVGFESSMSIMGSAYNPPEMMQNTASVTSPYPFLGQATLVNSSNSLMPVSFNTSVITTATAIANSTKFQSLWMRIYSSHSN